MKNNLSLVLFASDFNQVHCFSICFLDIILLELQNCSINLMQYSSVRPKWQVIIELSHRQILESSFIKIQMSSHRAMTLSMESLNKLYFQFLQRFVLPNISKQVNEIVQLMRQKTAYEVHRYLEETLATPADNYSTHTNSSLNSSTGNLNNLTSAIPPNNYSYQFPLPSQADHPKPIYTDNSHTFDKPYDKQLEDSGSFKNKLGMRRVHTGLAYQDQPRPYDPYQFNKHTIDDNLMTVPSISNHMANEGLINIPTLTTGINSDFKVDYAFSKEPTQNKKSKIMLEQVRKISKVFNEGHSKIEKYSKNGNQAQNKLFNLNVSTKLEKRDQGTWLKEYPTYQAKLEIHSWKM